MWNNPRIPKHSFSARRRGRKRAGFIFVISGPSGSGKTTLAKKLLKQPQLKQRFIKSISCTTRPRRPGEKQGRDYFFISPQEFRRLLKEKKFLEHTHYLGYDYATPRDYLELAQDKGRHIILCLDIKGTLFVKRRYPDRTVTIFVKPPSLNTARERILARCAKTKLSEVNKRIELAGKELNQVKHYDYYLINDNLNSAIKRAKKIIEQILKQ